MLAFIALNSRFKRSPDILAGSLFFLKGSVTRVRPDLSHWNVRASIAVRFRPQYAIQTSVRYCGYTVIVRQRTGLVKWNGSDVAGAMKYCPCCWTTPARRSELAPKVVTTESS
jgi:hypothetical protein